MPIIPYLGVVFSFVASLSSHNYCFGFLLRLNEILTFLFAIKAGSTVGTVYHCSFMHILSLDVNYLSMYIALDEHRMLGGCRGTFLPLYIYIITKEWSRMSEMNVQPSYAAICRRNCLRRHLVTV